MTAQENQTNPTNGWVELASETGPVEPSPIIASPPPTRLMKFVDRTASFILGFSMYLFYPAILIVILIDVTGRNFFATPLSWAFEGSGLFLIAGIFLAVPRVELDRDHILLDILYARYTRKAQLTCDMLTRLLCFVWMLATTIRSSIEIYTSYSMRESGTDFRAPFWPMRVIMTLGFLVLALALLSNAIDCYRKLRAGGRS